MIYIAKTSGAIGVAFVPSVLLRARFASAITVFSLLGSSQNVEMIRLFSPFSSFRFQLSSSWLRTFDDRTALLAPVSGDTSPFRFHLLEFILSLAGGLETLGTIAVSQLLAVHGQMALPAPHSFFLFRQQFERSVLAKRHVGLSWRALGSTIEISSWPQQGPTAHPFSKRKDFM